jgi:DNA-binding NtrC family response regulator
VRILIVDDDDGLRSWLAKELEARAFEVLQAQSGDEGLHIYQKDGPFEFVLTDFRFIPGVKIKEGVQLVTAIHEINPRQRLAIMTADPKEAKRRLPEALRGLPVLRKPFKLGQVLRLLRQPVLPL